MEKIDLRKQLKHLYAPSAKKVELVEVPALQFALVDGVIEPGHAPGTSPAFQQALEVLYGAAYTLKFMVKQRPQDPLDYTVMGLEAQWWVEGTEFDIRQPAGWRWTAMILQPDFITAELFEQALAKLHKKKDNPAIDRLRLETFCEGLSMQILHIGPYSEEPATVAKMEAFAHENGWQRRGRHHEIYLGDPMRSNPAKLKTILRQPVEQARP